MVMDNKVEDIYLKGMMAFSAKEFQKAYGYWRDVLELMPDHEAAKKGILKLKQMKKKKTPNEVLKDIKKFYAEQNYDRANTLCRLLVDRFPDNQDLQGLKKKIELRLQKESEQPSDETQEPAIAPAESTMYFQKKAEDTNWTDTSEEKVQADDTSPDSDEVSQLIQQGVTLYEIQDLEQAMVVWEQALALEPGNKIAQDYLQNVKSQMNRGDESTPESDTESSPVENAMPDGPPDKEQLVTIYNEGKDLYKDKKYQEALEKWRYILNYYPNHKETLLCVERAEKGIQEDETYLKTLEEAEAAYTAGNYSEAEALILPVVIKAPHLDGPKNLKTAIDERKKQIMEIKNLEMEARFSEASAEASDDEITQYFTPTTESKSFTSVSEKPRMVVSAVDDIAAEKNLRTRILRGLGVVAVIMVAATGFFIWKNWSEMRQRIIADAPVKVTIPRIIKWYSNEARVNDYMEMAAEYKNLGDHFMAYCAYDKVLKLTGPAITELIEQKNTLEVLGQIRTSKTTALEERKKAKEKIVSEELNKDDFEKALKGWEAEDAEKMIPIFRAALSQNIDDIELREYLSRAESQVGMQYVKKLGTLQEALNCFKKAAVLGPKKNANRGHYKVIQLFYTNSIDDHERRQWFFLFSGN